MLDSIAAKQGRLAPLVGRDGELGQLRQFLDRVVRGTGGLLLIQGEPGIGKTRLIVETRTYASQLGVTCLSGSCIEGERGIPYAPWLEMLREFVKRSSKSAVFKVARANLWVFVKLLPELADRVWLAPPPESDPENWERPQYLETVAGYFARLADEAPLLLCLDDLGWADSSSLDLLRSVARSTGSRSIGVVAAVRDAQLEENPTLRSLFLDHDGERRATILSLERLDSAQVGELIGRYFGEREVSPDFQALIFERSGGNPLFVTEILLSLADEGSIYRTPRGWERKPISEIKLPASIRGTIQQRLDRTDDDARSVLRMASILGSEFSFDLLEKVCQLEGEKVLGGLEEGLRAKLIQEREAAGHRLSYTFAHPLIQEVLASEVSLVRGRITHLKAAQALEAMPDGGSEERAAEVAYHYLRGHDSLKALPYCERAGRRATRVFAHAEAVRWFRTALELLEEGVDPSRTGDILSSLADETILLGEKRTVQSYLERAVKAYESAGAERKVASALVRLALFQERDLYDFESAMRSLEKARKLLEAGEETTELARTYLEIAHLHLTRGELPEATAMNSSAVALAEKLGEAEILAPALRALASNLPYHESNRAKELLDRSVKVAETPTLSPKYIPTFWGPVINGRSGALYFWDFSVLGHTVEALRGLEHVLEEGRQLGFSAAVRDTEGQGLARLYLQIGDFSTAFRLARASYDYAVREYPTPDRPNLLNLAALAGYRGEVEESEAFFQRGLGLSKSSQGLGAGRGSTMWARFLIGRGEFARAEELLLPLVQLFERARGAIALVGIATEALDLLVEIDLQKGDPASARGRLDRLKEVAKGFNFDTVYGFSYRAEGRWAAASGDLDSAVNHFQRSIALWTKLQWKVELAHTVCLLGETYQKFGRPDLASGPLDRALQLFTTIDAKPFAERVVELKSRPVG